MSKKEFNAITALVCLGLIAILYLGLSVFQYFGH